MAAADTFELWPENVESMAMFLQVQTQWRHGASGRPTGLDYAGVRAFLPARAWRSQEFRDDLQVMERAALLAMKG